VAATAGLFVLAVNNRRRNEKEAPAIVNGQGPVQKEDEEEERKCLNQAGT